MPHADQSFWYDETYNTFTIPMDPTGDDNRYDDLCMGTTRSFDSKLKPGKYDLVGVNCEDGTSAEGDILFTMYPKYTLSY